MKKIKRCEQGFSHYESLWRDSRDSEPLEINKPYVPLTKAEIAKRWEHYSERLSNAKRVAAWFPHSKSSAANVFHYRAMSRHYKAMLDDL